MAAYERAQDDRYIAREGLEEDALKNEKLPCAFKCNKNHAYKTHRIVSGKEYFCVEHNANIDITTKKRIIGCALCKEYVCDGCYNVMSAN